MRDRNLSKISAPRVFIPGEKVFRLWNTSDKIDRLTVVNEQDFPEEDLLKSLGIGRSSLRHTFGICDEEEIVSRQALSGFLLRNPEFRKWVREQSVQPELPAQRDSFLEDYVKSKEVPYWKTVKDFCSMLQEAEKRGEIIPPKLATLRKILVASGSAQEAEEKMAKVISDKVASIAVLDGYITATVYFAREENDPTKFGFSSVQIEGDSRDHYVRGYCKYAYSVTTLGGLVLPSWKNGWTKFWGTITGYKAYLEKKAKREHRERYARAYQGTVVSNLPESIQADVKSWVRQKFGTKRLPLAELPHIGGAGHLAFELKIQFHFDNEGLVLSPYSLEMEDSLVPKMAIPKEAYHGYTPEQYKRFEEARKRIQADANKSRGNHVASCARVILEEKFPGFFNELHKVSSRNTSAEFQWFAIPNMYRSDEFSDVVKLAERHRKFFGRQIEQLGLVSSLINSLERTANRLSVPLCEPRILPSEAHLVAFDNLAPIQIALHLEEGDGISPVSLPSLNGQMIGLTGKHGGGKTQTILAVAANIYLAQSGLPVFAECFELNVKRVLGLLFIERGRGSTIETILDKIQNINRVIKGYDGHEVVLILDELGSATQETSGLELGKMLLAKLVDMNISVLYSTQIMDLAEYVERKLGGVNFQVDSKHQITPGIGDGGLGELLERRGITEELRT